MKRCIFLQLPTPSRDLDGPRDNVPVAAGFLAAFALQEGLGDRWEFEIVPRAEADILGDAALAETIAAREPDLLALTLYLWNSGRTLDLAAEVKRRSPRTRVVIGGPEVTADNGWVVGHPAVDWAATGEGEATFAEILAILAENRDPAGLPGTLAFRDGEIRAAPTRPSVSPLDRIPSPFLAGLIDLGPEGNVGVETVRGCAYRCTFCYYYKTFPATQAHSTERVRAEIAWAAARGAREVVILDPTFNARRDVKGFLRELARGRRPDHPRIHAEVRAELIDEEGADLHAAAGIGSVEAGLQSANPEALALIDRRTDLRKFARGVRLLEGRGIEVRVDLIIGLPGETRETTRESIRYVRDEGLGEAVQVFPLEILPWSELRRQAEGLGIPFQPRPPYYARSTPLLTNADLRRAHEEAEEAFGVTFDPPAPFDLAPEDDPAAGPVRRVLLDLDRPGEAVPRGLPDRLAASVTVRVKGRDVARDLPRATRALRALAGPNPHATWDLLVESARPVEDADLERLLGEVANPDAYLNNYHRFTPGAPPFASARVEVVGGPISDRAARP